MSPTSLPDDAEYQKLVGDIERVLNNCRQGGWAHVTESQLYQIDECLTKEGLRRIWEDVCETLANCQLPSVIATDFRKRIDLPPPESMRLADRKPYCEGDVLAARALLYYWGVDNKHPDLQVRHVRELIQGVTPNNFKNTYEGKVIRNIARIAVARIIGDEYGNSHLYDESVEEGRYCWFLERLIGAAEDMEDVLADGRYPSWKPEGSVSRSDLEAYRLLYFSGNLAEDAYSILSNLSGWQGAPDPLGQSHLWTLLRAVLNSVMPGDPLVLAAAFGSLRVALYDTDLTVDLAGRLSNSDSQEVLTLFNDELTALSAGPYLVARCKAACTWCHRNCRGRVRDACVRHTAMKNISALARLATQFKQKAVDPARIAEDCDQLRSVEACYDEVDDSYYDD